MCDRHNQEPDFQRWQYDDYEARLHVYVYLATTLMDIPFMGRYSHTWITYDPRFYRLCHHYLSLKKLFVVGLHVHNTFLYNLHHGPGALSFDILSKKIWNEGLTTTEATGHIGEGRELEKL